MKWPVPSDWPHSECSERIYSAPHRWHVQRMGQGPLMLLLHGAGGSLHSFAALMPLLASRFTVVAIDLPGHGFTQPGARHRSGLIPMAEDIEKLCAAQGWQPDAIVGHSAGCAVALQLSRTILSPRGQPPKVIGINAALSEFNGLAGVLFPAMAKALASLPFTAQLFAGMAGNPERVKSLISGTGSELDSNGLRYYEQLVSDKDHVDGALLMMAQWSLAPLLRDLETLQTETLLIAGDRDKTVSPDVSRKAAHSLPNGECIVLPDLGHLAHEEAPDTIADLILRFADQSDS